MKMKTSHVASFHKCLWGNVSGWLIIRWEKVAAGQRFCVRCWVSAALCWNASISELRGECGLLSGSFTSQGFASSWESIRGCHAIRASCQEHADACARARPPAAPAPSSVRLGIVNRWFPCVSLLSVTRRCAVLFIPD